MDKFAEAQRTWALATDPRTWLILLILGGAVLGRSGVFRSRWFDLLKPYRTRPRSGRPAPAPAAATNPLRDPLFLFLLVISATAVTAWIVMRMTVTTTRFH